MKSIDNTTPTTIQLEGREFSQRLLRRLFENARGSRRGNLDTDRFGRPEPASFRARVRDRLLRSLLTLCRKPHCLTYGSQWEQISEQMVAVSQVLDGLEHLYGRLADDESRSLLVDLVAYRILGRERMSLELDRDDYWKRRDTLRSLFNPTEATPLPTSGWTLAPVNLSTIGYPITIHSIPIVLHTIFESKQYEYRRSDFVIKASEGEIVIDAGGCWGDAALYFANEVGGSGQVYTFEFIPANLKIMRRNFALNSKISNRITVIERPVWASSDELLYFSDRGPGSQVSSETFAGAEPVRAISLDDFVKNNRIQKVDFIKMDIEGAELSALRGAIEVIKTFRPKLAISIYHRLCDFRDIPEFILRLNSGYKLFLGHYTVHSEETVLFATTQH